MDMNAEKSKSGGDELSSLVDDHADRKEQSITDVLAQLTSLFTITSRGHQVHLERTPINVLTYGPNELKMEIITREDPLFDVVPIGDQKKPYLLFKPYDFGGFENLSEMLDYFLNGFEIIAKKGARIGHEPPKVLTKVGERYDPECLGIPFEQLMQLQEIGKTTLPNHLNLVTNPLPNSGGVNYFCKVRVMMTKSMAHLRNQFFGMCNVTTNGMRRIFLNQYKRVLEGQLPTEIPAELNQRFLMFPLAEPFNLCRTFSNIPLGPELSYTLVCEVLTPRIELKPLSPNIAAYNTASSSNKMNFQMIMDNIAFDSNWDEALYAYFSSFISPGIIELCIDFSDFEIVDNMRVVAAFVAKLILMYSTERRWRNVHLSSVKNVDSIILSFMVSQGMVEFKGSDRTQVRYSDYKFSKRNMYDGKYFTELATSADGRGWMNSGKKFFGHDSDVCVYQGCARRQLYQTKYDNLSDIDDFMYGPQVQDIGIFMAIREIMDSVKGRREFDGLSTTFAMHMTNMLKFFVRMNDYNRKNWASGLRINENAYNNDSLFHDCTKVINVKSKCLLYMFKAFASDAPFERRIPFPIQFRIECGLAHDFIIMDKKYKLLRYLVDNYLQLSLEFTRTELIKKILPMDGPLGQFFEKLQALRLVGKVPRMAPWADHTRLSLYYDGVISLLTRSFEDISITRDYGFKPKIPKYSKTDLERCARESSPFMPHTIETMEHELRLSTLSVLLQDARYYEYLSDNKMEGVRFDIPTKYSIRYTKEPVEMNIPFRISYGTAQRTVKNNLSMGAVTIPICDIPSRAITYEWDLALRLLPEFQNGALTTDLYKRNFFSLEEWCSAIADWMNEVDVIQLPAVSFISFFDFESTSAK